MNARELKEFISWENKRLLAAFDHGDKEKEVLYRSVKVSEEMGELSDQILHSFSMQRKEKTDTNLAIRKEKLSQECADVILTTLLLAKSLEVDIWDALEKKITIIKNRDY